MLDIVIELIENGEITVEEGLEYPLMSFEKEELYEKYHNDSWYES